VAPRSSNLKLPRRSSRAVAAVVTPAIPAAKIDYKKRGESLFFGVWAHDIVIR
jgi:hypothetical protein